MALACSGYYAAFAQTRLTPEPWNQRLIVPHQCLHSWLEKDLTTLPLSSKLTLK